MQVADTRQLVPWLGCLPAGCSSSRDGCCWDSPASQQSCSGEPGYGKDLLLLFTTCFCSYFYPESVVQCSSKVSVFISKDHECHLTEGEINSRVSHRNLSSLCSNHQLIPELFWIWKIQAWLFRTQIAALEWRQSQSREKKFFSCKKESFPFAPKTIFSQLKENSVHKPTYMSKQHTTK